MNHHTNYQDELNRLSYINQLILDSVAEGIYCIDLEAKVIFWNSAAEEMTGYTLEELTHQNLHSLIHHSNHKGEYVPFEQCPVYHALCSGENIKITEDLFWRKDGTSFPVEYTVKTMKQHGEQVGCVITFRDISEKKKAEQIISEWEKGSAVGHLAAGIAHEIRNPITSLKGFLKLMQMNGTVKEEYIQIMDSEFDRIEGIIQELLTFSKPSDSQYRIEEMGELIRQVVTLLEPQALLQNVSLSADLGGSLLYASCIGNQIKQVLINLIKNAIEAIDRPDGRVHIRLLAHAGTIIIQIKDNGPGIPPGALEKLGEAFYSTKEGGTGLGIMVTNNIVRNNHGGTLKVDSQEGVGTTFTVTLAQSPSP